MSWCIFPSSFTLITFFRLFQLFVVDDLWQYADDLYILNAQWTQQNKYILYSTLCYCCCCLFCRLRSVMSHPRTSCGRGSGSGALSPWLSWDGHDETVEAAGCDWHRASLAFVWLSFCSMYATPIYDTSITQQQQKLRPRIPDVFRCGMCRHGYHIGRSSTPSCRVSLDTGQLLSDTGRSWYTRQEETKSVSTVHYKCDSK